MHKVLGVVLLIGCCVVSGCTDQENIEYFPGGSSGSFSIKFAIDVVPPDPLIFRVRRDEPVRISWRCLNCTHLGSDFRANVLLEYLGNNPTVSRYAIILLDQQIVEGSFIWPAGTLRAQDGSSAQAFLGRYRIDIDPNVVIAERQVSREFEIVE